MILTLQPCTHRFVRRYSGATGVFSGLCESCFQRLVRPGGLLQWRVDHPTNGTCPHNKKVEITSQLTFDKPYRNAMCVTCGAAFRSPTGSNSWQPLREYRFIVKEWA